jgi:hypothetical protein
LKAAEVRSVDSRREAMMRVAILILLGSGLFALMMAKPQAAEEPRPAAAEAKKAPATPAKGEKESLKAAPNAPAEPGKGEVLLSPPAPPGPVVPVKTRMVRALLDALNGIQGLEPEQKDGVTRSLLSADEELSRVLGGNSKRLILQANKKPPIPVIGGPSRPVLIIPETPVPPPGAGPVPPPAVVPPAAVPPVTVPNPGAVSSGPGKNSTVQALLKTLDGMQGEDPKVKEELRKILLETERKLNEVQVPGKRP